jgi:hypothetical protein
MIGGGRREAGLGCGVEGVGPTFSRLLVLKPVVHAQDDISTARRAPLFFVVHEPNTESSHVSRGQNTDSRHACQDEKVAWTSVLRKHWQPQADPGAHG